MTRIARLEPHLSSDELKNRYKSASDRVESRRWHLLWLVSQWDVKFEQFSSSNFLTSFQSNQTFQF